MAFTASQLGQCAVLDSLRVSLSISHWHLEDHWNLSPGCDCDSGYELDCENHLLPYEKVNADELVATYASSRHRPLHLTD